MLKTKIFEVALATSMLLLVMVFPHFGGLSQGSTSIDISQFYLDSNCKVKCHSSSDGCRNTPSRKDICKALSNENWCCQEFKYASASPMLKAASDFASDGTCPAVAETNCRSFDGRPRDCRLSCNCAYNCVSGKCKDSKEISDKPCFSGCWNHCQDRCGCKGNVGCIYDPGSGICKSQLERYCKLNHFSGNECGRKGAFYVIGDHICQNMVKMGFCALDMVLVSANLGSDKVAKDSQGIEYKAENEIKKDDPLGISKSISFSAGDIKVAKEKDKDLYTSAVIGNANSCNNGSKKCIDYSIPIMNWEGDYELALRMHEGVYDKKGKRRFSVYFANIELFSELDIMSYTNEKFRPLDLMVNFKVTDEGKTITIKGRGPTQVGSQTKLSLCSGECGEDNGFLVSAFHIIKQKKRADTDSCDTSKPLEECENFHADACRRADSIYSYDGRFCKTTKQAGNCYIGDQMLAVNFNGDMMVDSRGIEYQTEDGNLYQGDGSKMRIAKETENVLPAEHDEDVGLYSGVIYGDPAKGKNCIWHGVRFCQDGRYEMVMRLVDDESDAPGQRKFRISFESGGELFPFKDVDIFYLSGGQKGKPVDIHFNFETIGSTIRYRESGRDAEFNTDRRHFYIGVCSGSDCKELKTTSFMVAAMSLVMFGQDPQLANKTCTKHHGDPCGCRYETFCEYDVVAEKCYGRKSVCSPQCGWKTDRDCRRAKEHIYYAHAGMVCQNKLDTMNKCEMKDTLIAANLGKNTKRHTDIYGIYYKTDPETPYDDPDKYKAIDGPRTDVLNVGVPQADLPLYNHFMYADWPGGYNPRCITYQIPVKDDGLHQLSLKLGEIFLDVVKKRTVSIKLNGQYLVREFEYNQYRLRPNAFDLNTNYFVYGAGSRMLMNGHPPSDIYSNRIPLSLCFGNCDFPNGYRGSHMLSAFSVIRFNHTVPCYLLKGDACGCQAQDNCQFNAVTKECVASSSACNIVRGGNTDCRRAGEHIYYADAGIICPSTKARGQCDVAKTIVADNYDKPEVTDSNGISFHAGISIDYRNNAGTLRFGGYDGSVLGVPAADLPLYERLMFGDKQAKSGSCLYFYIEHAGDGSYELRIRPFQTNHNKTNENEFDIWFNEQPVVQAFDINSIRLFPYAFELNVHFKVLGGGTQLKMSGHPTKNIANKNQAHIQLRYCYGKCKWPNHDPTYSIAAMSVVKFKQCSDFKNDPCGCRGFAGCEFNSLTKECGGGESVCSKISYGNDDTCWRGGPNVFYSHNGIVCPKLKGSGNCVESVILYEQYFAGQLSILQRSAKKKKCYRQAIPLDGDGDYELSVKVGEVNYEPPNKPKKRSQDYRFNGQYIVHEFDAAVYRKYPTKMDFNIQFNVTGGGTKLQMRGYPVSNVIEDTVIFKICSGDCDEYDQFSQLSGLRVVKFQRVSGSASAEKHEEKEEPELT